MCDKRFREGPEDLLEENEYYTKSEIESYLELKSSINVKKTETYTVHPEPNDYPNWTITFRRLMIGVVTIVIYCPGISAVNSAGQNPYQDIFIDIPSKFRPDTNMYFLAVDVQNAARPVGILSNGKVRIYDGSNVGCYGVITFMGRCITDDSVVDYYKQSVYETVEYINNLGSGWSSFVLLTDTHSPKNKNHSQNLIRFILENSSADKCFWLGDVLEDPLDDTTKLDYIAYASPLISNSNQMFFSYGNHERIPNVSGAAGLDGTFFNDFLCDKLDVISDSYINAYGNVKPTLDNEGNLVPVVCSDIEAEILKWAKRYYYFIDDYETCTRYMVINTSSYNQTGMPDSQVAWIRFCSQFGTGYENWNLIVLAHISVDTNAGLPVSSSSNSTAIKNALSACNGNVIGYFCGHHHIDNFSIVSSATGKNFAHVVLICDKQIANPHPPHPAPVNRTTGTINEHAITVVSFNRTSGDVKMKRVGAVTPGMTLQFNYLTINNS